MKIYETVKTEKRANEIIKNYIKEKKLKNVIIKNSTCRCECGETQCVTCSNVNINDEDFLILVAWCDSCGNDDAFVVDVLNIL